MEQLYRIGLRVTVAAALAMLGVFGCGCGADTGTPPDPESADNDKNGQVEQAEKDTNPNDPWKQKRCPPGQVPDSESGECPEGHQHKR